MKNLFWGFLFFYSINLYAAAPAAPTECEKETTACTKKPKKEQLDCFNKLADKCNKEDTIKKSPVSACTEDIKGTCKDKTGDKMLECLQHSSNKKCAEAVKKKPVSCPPNPCKLDYGKTDADEIFECHMAFNEKNPGCSIPLPKAKQ